MDEASQNYAINFNFPQGHLYNDLNSVDDNFKSTLQAVLSDIYRNHDNPSKWDRFLYEVKAIKGIGLEDLVGNESGLIFNRFIDLKSDDRLGYRMYVSYKETEGFRDSEDSVLMADRKWYQITGHVRRTPEGVELISEPAPTRIRGYRRITSDFDKYTNQDNIEVIYSFINQDYIPETVN